MAKAVAAALVLLVIVAMAFEAQAQGCPGVLSYQSCQSAVTAYNQMPSGPCCAQIATVLRQSNGAACLCAAMTSSVAKQFKVITSEALKLPSKCRLNYQKGVRCAGEYYYSLVRPSLHPSCQSGSQYSMGHFIHSGDYNHPFTSVLRFHISGFHRPVFAFGCLE